MRVIQNVQALRALAALIVVGIHIEPLFRTLGIVVPNGGVDLFFVISGFIMVVVARDQTPGDFLRRRVIRVVPLYWILTLFTFFAALAAPRLFANTHAGAFDLFRSLLFIPFAKAGVNIPQPILFVGWTLNYEAFFYALFASGLLFGRRGIAVPVGAIVALVIAGALLRPTGVIAAFYTSPILLEFLFGMGVGLAYQRYEGAGRLYAVLPILAGSAVLMMYGDRFFDLHRAFASGLPAAIFLSYVLALERQGRTLADFKLGDASYAIYLAHPFLTGIVLVVFAHLPQTEAVALGLIGLTLAAASAVGLAIHFGLERPIIRLLGRVGRRPRREQPNCPEVQDRPIPHLP